MDNFNTSNADKFKSLGLALAIHIGLLLILFFYIIRTPLPVGGLSGIEVNLGFSEDGMGDNQSLVAAPEGPQLNPNPEVQSSPSQQGSSASNNVITQNIEDNPVLNQNSQNSTINSDNNSSGKNNADNQSQQTVDKSALFPGKKTTTGGGGGSNEGVTGKPGDQGVITGNPFSKNRGDGGSGGNSAGTGNTDYDLTGRSIVRKTTFIGKWDKEGKIVVKIWVNNSGRVIRAVAGAPGTTVTDSELWRKAEAAALNAQFNAIADSDLDQAGKIVFRLGFQN